MNTSGVATGSEDEPMSTAFAMSAVSAVLQHFLQNALSSVTMFGGSVAISAKAPDLLQHDIIDGKAQQNQINLFLHQVTYNPAWRNVGLPSLGADGKTPIDNPPLALDLHYLLTAYGSDDWQAEALLGHALMMLHQFPVIARKDITLALNALPAGAFAVVLQASKVADQIEMIKITPSTLGREEMAWLWTALKADYRPTFPFQVSVVLMEPELQLGFPLPVLSRNIVANPIQPAQLLQVAPPDRQISAAPGDTVTVTGIFLKGATKVSLTFPRLGIQATVPATSVTNNSLQFVVPIETPLLPFPAGIYDVAVLFTDPLGNVTQTAGPLPLAVAPVIQIVPPPIVVKTATDTLITLTFSPFARPNQAVSLAIGSQSVTAQRFETNKNTLDFLFAPPLGAGSQLARLQIDGAPSQVQVDWTTKPPKFLGPMVTI
jgi:hypothetical protein